MIRNTIIGWITLLSMMIPAKSFAGANLILNLTPGFIVYSPDAKGFRASDGWKIDEVSGFLSNISTISAGVGVDTEVLYFDMTGGFGYMWSSSITSSIVMGDLALRFKLLRDEKTLGPHITFFRFRPEWEGDAEIDLSHETGIAGGLSFTIGSEPFSILAALDYLHLSVKVEPPGFSMNQDELNMSGIVFQIGMIMRF